ncbi:MAG: hypothetical protein R3C13_06065 [Hyphomonas sp.]|uniref:energy transducer TonB n=1 Tax=Hyphomonas sp. TaxID=87 RepID=UPI0035276F58
MRAALLTLALAACLSACGLAPAPEDGGTDMAAEFDKPAAPASFEDAEKAKTDAMRSGQNTYADTCGPLRARLDATPLPASMQARVDESDVAKLGGPKHPAIVSAGTVSMPAQLSARNKSAVCDLVFDIDETGTPQTPEARCSDPDFEPHALATLASIRFQPYTLNGKALPVSGILMPMEFCVSD